MQSVQARVIEISLDPAGGTAAWVACPPHATPKAGQYCLAHAPGDGEPLEAVLFASEISSQGFRAPPPVPHAWIPGASLTLRGPLGKGFSLEGSPRRLALAALGETAARLLPLARQAAAAGADIAWFSDAPLPPMPASHELNPLRLLADGLSWADFLALDLPVERLGGLGAVLGLHPEQRLACPAQVLVIAPMPCGGAAACGACAVPTRRGWRLACQDGPVFNLSELEW